MISIFKRKKDHKLEKLIRAASMAINDLTNMRDDFKKLLEIAERLDEVIGTISNAAQTSLAGQLTALKKMEKFFEVQIKWTEDERKTRQSQRPTEDDARF